MERPSFSGVRRLAAAFLRELARAAAEALTVGQHEGKQENADLKIGAANRQQALPLTRILFLFDTPSRCSGIRSRSRLPRRGKP